MKLTYVIKFVADMDRAVAFHRDTLGLPLKFASPHWSELRPERRRWRCIRRRERMLPERWSWASVSPDLQKFYGEMSAKGVVFSMPPTKQDFGDMLARFVDSEGGNVSVSAA